MKHIWRVLLQEPVVDWLKTLPRDEVLKIYAALDLLSAEGPQLGRPYADTLQGSKYPNLKELRVQSKSSVFRLFFIFDPIRQAIVLCGGNKKGKNEKLFYREMIEIAEQVYDAYLSKFEMENKK
ncbi:type II toxin-antitoxin system RelE/ParE family toxin [Avibacterium sp. 21-594]|uniref:type II toxin-antitoxin system RelE/ParE family toxin n=1 Tax=Avibacterium sp. 21-594 TaxID=2911535 RepID=UPI002245F154|nr:type II toxin-antitoxin system RelE/ParE family toxin [Avibacterium sp. 21-594]MCW9715675.1 type II toxin-antitoxin system RelE/ParE family toxin [Avibacterium sp. 21-594]